MAVPPEPTERRLHERKRLRTLAVVSVPGVPGAQLRTVDISLGGIGVVSDRPMPVGADATVRLNLTLPNHTTATITAASRIMRVIYTARESAFVIGLSFVRLDAESRSALSDFLAYPSEPFNL